MSDAPRAEPTFTELAGALAAAFAEGVSAPWPEERFQSLARAVFSWQFETNPVYRRFCEARGGTPDSVCGWEGVPPVPAAAFERLPLVSGDPTAVERVFRTSGTTRVGRRGEHRVLSLALYRASLLPQFEAHVLPDGAALAFLSLIPSPERLPDSSLSTMVGKAMEAFGAAGSGWFADAEGGLDLDGLRAALDEAERAERPVLLLGTAFAFVHWLDALEAAGAPRWRLPAGSRLLETGGFKGRSRVVPRAELYEALRDRLGLGPEWMVNEYGMTELLSQYYEAGLGRPGPSSASLAEALEARRIVPPPWMRFRVLHPATLEPLPDGEAGLLAHFDLANAGSVSAVLTEDVGRRDAGGLALLGRTPGAEPRGCSVAMDELLSAAGEP